MTKLHEATALGDVPVVKRAGATVIAPDGQRAAYWSMTGDRNVWLWRDGVLLDPIAERQARTLPLVGVANVYRPGVKDCTRRDAHVWPDELGPDSLCTRCGLVYREFSCR